MKTCPYCDAPIPDASMKFCGQCGLKLDYEEGSVEGEEGNHVQEKGREEGGIETPRSSLPWVGMEKADPFSVRREATAGDGRPPAMDADEAVRVSQETEEQMLQATGSLMSPGGGLMAWGVELQLAMMLIGCFYPAVWAVLGLFYVTICAVGVTRGKVKKLLKAHDIEGAKVALSSLKTWNLVMTLVEVAMGGIEIWGILQLVKSF